MPSAKLGVVRQRTALRQTRPVKSQCEVKPVERTDKSYLLASYVRFLTALLAGYVLFQLVEFIGPWALERVGNARNPNPNHFQSAVRLFIVIGLCLSKALLPVCCLASIHFTGRKVFKTSLKALRLFCVIFIVGFAVLALQHSYNPALSIFYINKQVLFSAAQAMSDNLLELSYLYFWPEMAQKFSALSQVEYRLEYILKLLPILIYTVSVVLYLYFLQRLALTSLSSEKEAPAVNWNFLKLMTFYCVIGALIFYFGQLRRDLFDSIVTKEVLSHYFGPLSFANLLSACLAWYALSVCALTRK